MSCAPLQSSARGCLTQSWQTSCPAVRRRSTGCAMTSKIPFLYIRRTGERYCPAEQANAWVRAGDWCLVCVSRMLASSNCNLVKYDVPLSVTEDSIAAAWEAWGEGRPSASSGGPTLSVLLLGTTKVAEASSKCWQVRLIDIEQRYVILGSIQGLVRRMGGSAPDPSLDVLRLAERGFAWPCSSNHAVSHDVKTASSVGVRTGENRPIRGALVDDGCRCASAFLDRVQVDEFMQSVQCWVWELSLLRKTVASWILYLSWTFMWWLATGSSVLPLKLHGFSRSMLQLVTLVQAWHRLGIDSL